MSATTLTIDKETARGFYQVAHELGINAADLAEKAIRRYLRQEAEHKIELEEAQYKAQLPDLLRRYEGRYIAMHQGEVIDSDVDELALYTRIRRDYPMSGILIKQVKPDSEVVWQMRSPRIQYD